MLNDAPDKDCYTLPNGECVALNCSLHGPLGPVELGAPIRGEELSPLEVKMATAILFMPEIGHLTVGVTKEIIRRCARVATEHFGGGAA